MRALLPDRVTVQQHHKPEGAEKGRCPGWCQAVPHLLVVRAPRCSTPVFCDLVDYPAPRFCRLRMPGACSWSVSAQSCSSASLTMSVLSLPTQFRKGKAEDPWGGYSSADLGHEVEFCTVTSVVSGSDETAPCRASCVVCGFFFFFGLFHLKCTPLGLGELTSTIILFLLLSYLFIYFWPCEVSVVAVCRLPLAVASPVAEHGLQGE